MHPVEASDEYNGLYYSSDSPPPASCDRIEQELHPGGMKIADGMLSLGETVCELRDPRDTDAGTEFLADCESEGSPNREIMTFRNTSDGLTIDDSYGRREWSLCSDTSTTGSVPSRWITGFAQGISETKVTNDQGDAVVFVCGHGTSEPLVSIHFEMASPINGPVEIAVDGQAFNFTAEDDWAEIDANCPSCMETYGALMTQVLDGKIMTVLPSVGSPQQFAIHGAREAFFGAICEGAGHLVRANHRACELIIDQKVVHSGQCSRSKYGSDETITAVGPDIFVMVFQNDDGTSAIAYWNGPTGGTHAHADIGEVLRDGSCWANRRSSICFEE